jgi:hypothetical protein
MAKFWTQERDHRLMRLRVEGRNPIEISRLLCRSESAIRMREEKLGLRRLYHCDRLMLRSWTAMRRRTPVQETAR